MREGLRVVEALVRLVGSSKETLDGCEKLISILRKKPLKESQTNGRSNGWFTEDMILGEDGRKIAQKMVRSLQEYVDLSSRIEGAILPPVEQHPPKLKTDRVKPPSEVAEALMSLRQVGEKRLEKLLHELESMKIITVPDLVAAAKAGKLSKIPGISDRTEENILSNLRSKRVS